jgi:hypothetical protein
MMIGWTKPVWESASSSLVPHPGDVTLHMNPWKVHVQPDRYLCVGANFNNFIQLTPIKEMPAKALV